ncbi:MAG TPA: hypothetical protein VI277_04635 [Candidatus Limnocylindria bacterium]
MSTSDVSRTPDGIGPQHLDARGRRGRASPASLVVFGAVVVLGLTGVLGHEREWSAVEGGTSLSVHMPETIRNGEFAEMRVTVVSEVEIADLKIGIEQGLWEDMTVNTMIPAATDESSADGEFRFTFGPLAAGTSFLLKVDAQTNPDIVGGNSGSITVYDGDTVLTGTDLDMRVLP